VASFIRELQRRRVIRVALVYGVVAWALVQIADTTFPHLGMPGWAVTLVIALVLLGFPIALILAWAFELTPDGVVRADAVSAVGRTRTAWFGAALTILAAGAIGTLLPRAVSGPVLPDAEAGAPTSASIAVLPFANLSGDADTEPFVSGLHHELLTQLSRLTSLDRVIPRTSVMAYAQAGKRIPVIAAELGVSLVLEAGVQRVDDVVRIHALLVDGSTERRLWSESYERELSVAGLFDVQAEIARRIAQELERELTPEEQRRIGTRPTDNLAAYDLYLRAIVHGERWSDEQELLTASALLEQAVELDPGFVAAWARLSEYRYFLAWAHDRLEHAAPADAALERAVALDADAVETLYAVAEHHYRRRNFEEALRVFERAEQLQPNLTGGIRAMILRRLGRWDESIALHERHVEANPRWYENFTALGHHYLRVGRYDDAWRTLERAVAIAPARGLAHMWRLNLALAQGDTGRAREVVEAVPPAIDAAARARMQAILAFYSRDFARALELWPREDHNDYLRLAVVAHCAGDRGRAAMFADSVRLDAERLLAHADSIGGELSVNARSRSHARLAVAHAVRGDAALTRRHAAAAADPITVEVDQAHGVEIEDMLVDAFVVLGDFDTAVQKLELLLSIPTTVTREDLIVNPLYDALRQHTGFRRLLDDATASGRSRP
jgi:TolB-like protein/cytochrome c-type biogenesis protein CcmH/NrfG